MRKTIFEKILDRSVPADIVFENEYVLSFRDVNPQAPVHVLVIPKTPMQSIAEADNVPVNILGHFMQGIALTARTLFLEKEGYRVVFNTGKNALQTVPYIHAHIIGGRKCTWPPG